MKKSVWRPIPFTNGFFQLSRDGQIRKVKNKLAFYSEDFLDGNIYEEIFPLYEEIVHGNLLMTPIIRIRQNGDSVKKYLAILMYETFHGIFDLSIKNILPINGNFLDVSLKNLSLCKTDDFYTYLQCMQLEKSKGQMEHVLSTESIRKRIGRSVSCYSNNGNLIKYYKSATEYCKDLELPLQVLRTHLSFFRPQFLDNKYKVIYGRGPNSITLNTTQMDYHCFNNSTSTYKNQLVRCYDSNGKLKHIYSNLLDASMGAKIDFEIFASKIRKSGSFIHNANTWIMDRVRRS